MFPICVLLLLLLDQSGGLVAQSCLTLCHPTGCSLPGSVVRGILQARILEWVAISFSIRSKETAQKWGFIL